MGLSDVPAWYAARYQSLAERHGYERAVALQLEYSLLERTIEREHVPAARELGMAIAPWSPLSSGLLAGKYRRTAGGARAGGRIDTMHGPPNPAFARLANPSNRAWDVIETVAAVAGELGRPAAEVALAWVIGQPGVTSTLLGATRLDQLDSNLAALALALPEPARARLDAVSAVERVHPYMSFGPEFQSMLHGGAHVRGWRS